MPSHVKLFFWLGAAAILYSVLSVAWYLTFPSPEIVAAMAKLPPAFRAEMQHASMISTIVVVAFWNGIEVLLLWLAAFRRQNWARWSYVALFLFHRLAPFGIALAYRRLEGHVWGYLTPDWSHPWYYLSTALILAAIAFSFTGNARDWFARARVPASA